MGIMLGCRSLSLPRNLPRRFLAARHAMGEERRRFRGSIHRKPTHVVETNPGNPAQTLGLGPAFAGGRVGSDSVEHLYL